MKTQQRYHWTARVAWVLLAVALLATPALGATFRLRAVETTYDVMLPDGSVDAVPMWAYALGNGAPTVPGPVLRVPAGDTSLDIVLRNELPQPVSILIPGQLQPLVPVTDPATGRVTSMTKVVPAATVNPDGTISSVARRYSWANLKPGTYLYHSGTHPAVQVQMGLYGVLIVEAADGGPYPGVASDNEAVVVLSEIDPLIHRSVASGKYGQAPPAVPIPGDDPALYISSTIDYAPKYFLINGALSPDAIVADHPVNEGEQVLLRFVNAGLRTHVPSLASGDWQVIAEDGNPYPYPRGRHAINLPASKTSDALLTVGPAGATTVFDRMLSLGAGAAMPEAGMRSRITVHAPDAVTLLTARYDATLNELLIRATETPHGALVTLSAVLTYADGTTEALSPALWYNANTGVFRRIYNPSGDTAVVGMPAGVTVTSNGGGSATGPVTVVNIPPPPPVVGGGTVGGATVAP